MEFKDENDPSTELCGQVVLQCRQKFESLERTQGETMGFNGAFFNGKQWPQRRSDYVCKHTPLFAQGGGSNANHIEWLTKKPEFCVPTRILVRVFPKNAPPDPE